MVLYMFEEQARNKISKRRAKQLDVVNMAR